MRGSPKPHRTKIELLREAKRRGIVVPAGATREVIEVLLAQARPARETGAERPSSKQPRRGGRGRAAEPAKTKQRPEKARRAGGRPARLREEPSPEPVAPARAEAPPPPARPAARAEAPREVPPEREAESSVTIVPRDPHWLYSYFRIADEKRERAMAALPGERGRPVLRVHDVSRPQAPAVHEVAVSGDAGSCFVESAGPGRPVEVELGVRAPGGEFAPIARSEVARAPAEAPSEEAEAGWPIDEAIEEVYRRAFRAIGVSMASPGVEEEEESARRRRRARAPGIAPVGSPGVEMGIGASEALAGAPTGQPAAIGQPGERGRRFFLEVGTDLVVFGATMPGSHVTLRGEPIALSPDGTFSTRMTLPDGVHDLDVRATSPDGVETRGVDIRVTRRLTESTPPPPPRGAPRARAGR